MGSNSTTPTRRALRPWAAVAIVAALLAAGAAVTLSTFAGSLPLTAGLVLLTLATATIILRRLTTPG